MKDNSLRANVRMTGVAKATVSKLLVDLGKACDLFHDEKARNVRSNRIECDEIWSFVGAKAKNVSADKEDVWGDFWTWTAIDPDTKLIVSFRVGDAKREMFDFIELFYNQKRRHSTAGNVSPAEFERRARTTQVA